MKPISLLGTKKLLFFSRVAKSLFFSILECFDQNPFEKMIKNEDFRGFLAFFDNFQKFWVIFQKKILPKNQVSWPRVERFPYNLYQLCNPKFVT